MAPTICMPEHVLTREEKASPYFCRQRVQFKREFGQVPSVVSVTSGITFSSRNSHAWRAKCPSNSSLSISFSKEYDDNRCTEQQARREGLLSIVARTIALVRRNHILQRRVDALRAETQEFINSVMRNSENRSQKKCSESSCRELSDEVSSTTTAKEDETLLDGELTSDVVSSSSTETVPSTGLSKSLDCV